MDKERSCKEIRENSEKFKTLVEWMRVIANSTKSTGESADDFGFSDEGVQRLKMKVIIAFSALLNWMKCTLISF